MRNVLMTLSALLALGTAPAEAHHSGALFYAQDQPIPTTRAPQRSLRSSPMKRRSA